MHALSGLAVSLLVVVPSLSFTAAQAVPPASSAPPQTQPIRVHALQDTTNTLTHGPVLPGGRATPLTHPRISVETGSGLRTSATTQLPPDPEVLGFAQSGEVASGAWQQDLRLDLVSTIAYFGININGNGTVYTADYGYSVWRSQATTDLMNAAHAAGDRVVLTVKGFDDPTIAAISGSEPTRRAAIGNIVNELRARGGDGVNVDFEGFDSSVASNFSTFVSELAQTLDAEIPSQSYLTVDVYATSARGGTMYDIAKLAGAVEALDVMAYGFTSPGATQAGPEAPLNGDWYNDEQAMTDFLALAPASKIILGVPYYGLKWSVSCGAGGCPEQAPVTCCGAYVTYSAALDDLNCALKLHQGFDPTFASPYAYWFSPATNDPCGGNHNSWREMWYDNAQSLGFKYDMVNQRGLRGIGIWALGYDSGHPDLSNEIAQKFTVIHQPTAPRAQRTQALAVVRYGSGLFSAFGYTTDGYVGSASQYPNGTWTPFVDLGGAPVAGVAAAINLGQTVSAFHIGSDDQVHSATQTSSGVWTSWVDLGGVLTGTPVALAYPNGLFTVFARDLGTGGVDSASQRPDGTWSAWASLGGAPTSDIAAFVNNAGTVSAFYTAADGHMHSATQMSNGGWTPWTDLGGALVGQPVAFSYPNGLFTAFARGQHGGVRSATQHPNGTWTPWVDLGGAPGSNVAALMSTFGTVSAFYIGSDSRLHSASQQPNGVWTPWNDLGGSLSQQPTAVSLQNGLFSAFGINRSTGRANSASQTPNGTWTPWVDLGGSF